MLYLVATPIGNLGDITYRAVEILKSCDYILCEDTRHSLPLLRRYEIQKPLKSLHKFNEAAREEQVLVDLREGKTIGLISDAGTPGIADPGSRMVLRCVEEGLGVQAIPGPCAVIVGLTASGLDTERFQFVGFLPKKKGELRMMLGQVLAYRGTSVCYESPHRVEDTLKEIEEMAPGRKIVIARELTKKFEEYLRGTAVELLGKVGKIKGEVTLLISGGDEEGIESTLTLEEEVAKFEGELGISRQEAIKAVANNRGLPKREVYNALLKKS
ncbi:MAG: 16S rRNA (cytidine(1402)-2'-O)-methyltransferase [Parachlamydia sp.]|nr:16S rRNA (cytidine(1402)-2'-O)-methyltransferase [Parachlamydia sp.]